MIVYRCVSERELAYLLGIKTFLNAPHGENTFNYEKDIVYKHFFYYYDSAKSFIDFQNINRYYDKYSIIMAYNIDSEILKEHFGLGTYNLKCISGYVNDCILKYFNTIYFPEFAIPMSLIKKDMIVGIGDSRRITPISYIGYDTMNDCIRENEKQFLEYEKWLFNNGTNVSCDLILKNKDNLFPIKNLEVNKKL